MHWFSHQHRTPRTVPPRTTAEKMSHKDCAPEDDSRIKCRTFSFFLSLVTLTFTLELGRDFCTMHLTTKFHHPTFNRSEVVMFTNKRTNWQTNRRHWKHPPRSTMLRRWVTKNEKQLPRKAKSITNSMALHRMLLFQQQQLSTRTLKGYRIRNGLVLTPATSMLRNCMPVETSGDISCSSLPTTAKWTSHCRATSTLYAEVRNNQESVTIIRRPGFTPVANLSNLRNSVLMDDAIARHEWPAGARHCSLCARGW